MTDRNKNKLETKSTKVQYWANGIMVGLMPIAIAQEKLNNGEAFIINNQAIGAITDGKKNA